MEEDKMSQLDELRNENKDITDLCHVLSVLVEDRSLHKNPVACELLDRFMQKVNKHLDHEGRSIYGEMLKHGDTNTQNVARQFMSNTHELKKLISKYNRKWCDIPEDESEAVNYTTETKLIFNLMCERIHMEDKRLFPLIEEEQTV